LSQPEEPIVPEAQQAEPVATLLPEEARSDEAWSDDGGDEAGGRRRRRRGGESKMPGEEVSHLNLTPMMDIMTILLVFLVMSFASDPGNINTSLTLHPPESNATSEMKPATSVTLTTENILVADQIVMATSAYQHTSGKQVLIPEIRNALDKERDRLEKLHTLGGPEFDGALLVIAHETTPYAMIADVLYSAGQAQFSKYELVVMKASGGGQK
jgi:biopolymer transport protein ExbD